MIEFIAGLAVLGLIGYIIYDKIYKEKRAKLLGQLLRVLLFEQVGNDKIYKNEFIASETNDEVLGVYINIKGIQKSIAVVNNDDYFPDQKYGKCLMVCKYAEDDYRVISPMREEEWYKKTKLKPEEYLETEVYNDPQTGEDK
jgi:hypothetical protein